MRAMQRLGMNAPTIGLFGINPHAGENGLFGDADERITKPAAERLRACDNAMAERAIARAEGEAHGQQ